MSERFLLLERSIRHDLNTIDDIYAAIGNPVLTETSSEDELRRFRHLFRYSYDVRLDPQRLRLVLLKAQQLQAVYRSQMMRFLDFLRAVQDDD
jgi:hypothetical protein